MKKKLYLIFDKLKENRQRLMISIIISCFICLLSGYLLTTAWLAIRSNVLVNEFDDSSVTCSVEENFDGETKSNVSIQNTGTIDAYIRVSLTFLLKDGDNIIATPPSPSDYVINFSNSFGNTWILSSDGYYYFTLPVPPSENTAALIDSVTQTSASDYNLELDIIAQSVQYLPHDAVLETWDSGVSSVNANGRLEVIQ